MDKVFKSKFIKFILFIVQRILHYLTITSLADWLVLPVIN